MRKNLLVLQLLLATLVAPAQGPEHRVRSARYEVDTFPVIYTMIGLVDTNIVIANIQHLQDYGTRNCLKPGGIQAQNWIKGHFVNYGLPVELQDFPMGGYNSSDNVIAKLDGHLHPDEYVVVGGHYDSYTGGSQEPGADDNASGTAGVMEIARILSQFEFDRSIVFCAFSAEEYGLFGSEAYASRAEEQGMNILGYFNLDMIGYKHPGEMIHTDMIAPASAEELSDFYKAVAAIYLPDFLIYDAVVIPGGSDHISFNEHGFMGIFPAEEDITYSPYIHTANDLIGPSVNCMLKAQKFIQAALASVVSLARPYSTVGQVEKEIMTPAVNMYPNPAGHQVTVELAVPGEALLEIFNVAGQRIRTCSMDGAIVIDLAGLPSGSYLVRITGSDFILNKKLMFS